MIEKIKINAFELLDRGKKVVGKVFNTGASKGKETLNKSKEKLAAGRLHGINHVGVTVTDFEAAVSWYNTVFGFHLVNELVLTPEQTNELGLYGEPDLTVRLGFLATQSGTMLEIFEFSPAKPKANVVWTRPGFTHVAISVSNAAAVKRRLEAKGVKFLTEVQHTDGTDWAFCQDPDGNLLEIIDYGKNRIPLATMGNTIGRTMKASTFAKYYS